MRTFFPSLPLATITCAVLTTVLVGIALAGVPENFSVLRKLYPIPTQNVLYVIAQGDVHGYTLTVARVDGRVMWHASYAPSDGQYHSLSLDTSRLRPGYYTLAYRSDLPGGAYAVRRFIVVR